MSSQISTLKVERRSVAERRRLTVVFGALMLAMLIAALDQTIVSTALPTIVGDLGGLTQLAWVVTAYILTSTISTPLYGKLGDLYGRKIVLQVALVVFLIGSALCGAAQSLTELILFRGLQGLGGGGEGQQQAEKQGDDAHHRNLTVNREAILRRAAGVRKPAAFVMVNPGRFAGI